MSNTITMWERNILRDLLILIVILQITTISCQQNPDSLEINDKIVIDPIIIMPEWLQSTVEKALPEDSIVIWVPTNKLSTSSLIKVPRFPRDFNRAELDSVPRLKLFEIWPIDKETSMEISGVRNEMISFQLAVISKSDKEQLSVKVNDLVSSNGDTLSSNNIRKRLVGYVPVNRSASEFDWSARYEDVVHPNTSITGTMNPDIIADPLYEFSKIELQKYRSQAIWFTIDIPENTLAGEYFGEIEIGIDGKSYREEYKLNISAKSIPSPNDYNFYVNMWLNPNSIANYYDVDDWSEEHWEILKAYFAAQSNIGLSAITTTITHEPWRVPWINGSTRSQTFAGYSGMVKWILKSNGEWEFDYSIFDRYVEEAIRAGIKKRINAYSVTSFRGKQRLSYIDEEKNIWEEIYFDSPKDINYQEIWSKFLKDFYSHLKEKGWENITYLSFDENPEEVLSEISNLIIKTSPHFSNMITIAGYPESHKFASGALSISYEFFPKQNLDNGEALHYIDIRNEQDLPTTFYLCGQPAHPNTFTFSPAIEGRLIPWLALKYNVDGYLRWAYNNWPQDVFKSPVYNFIQGDEYIVYPGKNGPISSIRLELLKEGIEDYELFFKYQKSLAPEDIDQIIRIATRNEDGRNKNVNDFNLVREIIEKSTNKN